MTGTGPLMANGQPNPTGTGRYCPPRICWCGSCAWWQPIPEPDIPRLLSVVERADDAELSALTSSERL